MNTDMLETLYIFGYGSLVWKPDFEYNSCEIGYIEGYKRRFWQGNTVQRGTPQKPGRVATLVPKKGGTVWGTVFKVCGAKNVEPVLHYLNNREAKLGGYRSVSTTFYPRDPNRKTKDVYVYMATPENSFYLGHADEHAIAKQVVSAHGMNGSNAEYVTRLAEFMREHIPEARDKHLTKLDKLVKHLIYDERHRA